MLSSKSIAIVQLPKVQIIQTSPITAVVKCEVSGSDIRLVTVNTRISIAFVHVLTGMALMPLTYMPTSRHVITHVQARRSR